MKKYKHLFFDLDETLWDYKANAVDTLIELFEKFELGTNGDLTADDFVAEFFRTNRELWRKFDKRLIDKDKIRQDRFPLIFERLGVDGHEDVDALQKSFIYESPKKGKLIDHADEILEALSNHYSMHIITNGFEEIQATKLKYSGLEIYFQEVVTSERANAQKPDPGIFLFAMEAANAKASESVMIGDNLITDIQGARGVGMEQVFFNPGKITHDLEVTHEINHLFELSGILLNV